MVVTNDSEASKIVMPRLTAYLPTQHDLLHFSDAAERMVGDGLPRERLQEPVEVLAPLPAARTRGIGIPTGLRRYITANWQ